jgi:hypothetical protein
LAKKAPTHAAPLLDALGNDVKTVTGDLQSLKKTVEGEYASNKDLQKLMTDVLLLWNSMKQLDASKADRSELERLALEYTNKLSEILKNLDDFNFK